MKETSIILYAPLTKPAGRRLLAAITEVVGKEQLEVFDNHASLTRRLRQPIYNDLICILFAQTRETLSSFITIGNFFRNLRLILLLPDDAPGTISDALTLYPRFISYGFGDFSDVAAVVAKMTGTARQGLKRRMKENRGRILLEKGNKANGRISKHN